MDNKKEKEQKIKVIGVDDSGVMGDEDFYDDCQICRAMKAAKKEGRELSFDELQELFRKANEEQKFKN